MLEDKKCPVRSPAPAWWIRYGPGRGDLGRAQTIYGPWRSCPPPSPPRCSPAPPHRSPLIAASPSEVRANPARFRASRVFWGGGGTFETRLGDAENQAGAWDDEALLDKRSKWKAVCTGEGGLPVGMGLGCVCLDDIFTLWCRNFIDSSRPSLNAQQHHACPRVYFDHR